MIVVSAVAMALAGCSTPLQFVPPAVGISQSKLDLALVSTVVTIAPKSEMKGKVQVAGGEADVTSLWKSALDDTLLRTAIFRDSSPRHVTLAVRVLQLSQSGVLGYGFDSVARYELIDRNTGQAIFTKDVEAHGHAKDYVGVNRVRNAASRSVQENIMKFVQELESARLPPG